MPAEACLPQAGMSLLPFSATLASQNINFYSIQMHRSRISQPEQNKPLHFSHATRLNAFLAPPIPQFTQNKSLHCKSAHFFYSIQMNGRKSLLTNH
jgi:hypothetical protein